MFICFEGIAGSGKTTQARLLATYLRNNKKKTVFVGAAYEGSRRKAVSTFINSTGITADQNAVMFLFQALHATHYHETMHAINMGQIVIADRWRQSFFSYHLYQKTFGQNVNLMSEIDRLAYRTLEPDIYFLIDLPAEIAYQRFLVREKRLNDHGLDSKDLKGFISVSKYYRQLAHNQNWHIIDGKQSKKAIFIEIKGIIDKML